MNNFDLKTPTAPFLEMWTFNVILELSPEHEQKAPPQWEIRNLVYAHLHGTPSYPTNVDTSKVIQKAILEIITDRLSCPDFRFFVTDYEERSGSLEIALVVVGALCGGVCGYGSFRQGLEYIYSDLKTLFGAIKGLNAKVTKRFKDRHIMTLDLNKPNVEL